MCLRIFIVEKANTRTTHATHCKHSAFKSCTQGHRKVNAKHGVFKSAADACERVDSAPSRDPLRQSCCAARVTAQRPSRAGNPLPLSRRS